MNRSAAFFRRRKFIVKKKLQYGLLATAFAYIAIVVLVIASSLFIPLMINMEKGGSSSEQAILAARFVLYLHKNFWPPLVLALFAIAFHSIMTSHRIAGPLYRISFFFREIMQGKLPRPIILRKDDYLCEEIDDINKAMDTIKTRFEEIKNAGKDLDRSIQDNTLLLTNSAKSDSHKAIERISEKLKILEEKLGNIRIEN